MTGLSAHCGRSGIEVSQLRPTSAIGGALVLA